MKDESEVGAGAMLVPLSGRKFDILIRLHDFSNTGFDPLE